MWQELAQGNPHDYRIVHPGTGTEISLAECVLIHEHGYQAPILTKHFYIEDTTGQWTYEVVKLA